MIPNDVELHQDIVEKCKTDDSSAQYELYRLYSKAMFNICLRITNDRDEAEDVLQEAFVSVFKNINSYKGTATIGAWIKRIVINGAINHLKRKKIETFRLEDEQLENIEETGANEEVDSYKVQRIKDAMLKLPDGYRMVFSLYLLEGYDHKEIAEILDITESTSKSQFNRAKNKIREIMNQAI